MIVTLIRRSMWKVENPKLIEGTDQSLHFSFGKKIIFSFQSLTFAHNIYDSGTPNLTKCPWNVRGRAVNNLHGEIPSQLLVVYPRFFVQPSFNPLLDLLNSHGGRYPYVDDCKKTDEFELGLCRDEMDDRQVKAFFNLVFSPK